LLAAACLERRGDRSQPASLPGKQTQAGNQTAQRASSLPRGAPGGSQEDSRVTLCHQYSLPSPSRASCHTRVREAKARRPWSAAAGAGEQRTARCAAARPAVVGAGRNGCRSIGAPELGAGGIAGATERSCVRAVGGKRYTAGEGGTPRQPPSPPKVLWAFGLKTTYVPSRNACVHSSQACACCRPQLVEPP